MWKDVLIVAAAAGLGEFVAQKFGSTIEAQAVSMKIPQPVAHAVVVGGTAAGVFLIVRSVL